MSSTEKQPAPAEQVFQLCMGFIPAIYLNVVAKLSVAEQLALGPKNGTNSVMAAQQSSEFLTSL